MRTFLRRLLWAALALLLLFQLAVFSQVLWWRWHDPQTTAFMNAERDRLATMKPAIRIQHHWVPYASIALPLKQAVIAAEDSGFVHHDGVDWEAIEKAARENLRRGSIRRGGSTITMQLAKNLFLSSDRSYLRKVQELVITAMLETVMDKRRILEIYLNTAEWGIGVFGIEAAARHYFGVPAAALDPAQSAWLASILPSPRRFDRQRQSEWISEKTLIILERMPKVAVPK